MLNGRVVAQIECDIQYIGDAEPPLQSWKYGSLL